MNVQTVYDRLIWSADVNDVPTIIDGWSRIPDLRLAKLDRLFIDRNGRSSINAVSDAGLRVFADTKFVEIPSKLEALAELYCRENRPWMLNCMAGCVSTGVFEIAGAGELDGLKRFADVCHTFGVLPCAVSVLTSKDDDEPLSEFAEQTLVQLEFGGRSAIEQVLVYADLVQRAGFTDLVCSPQEVAAIRSDSRFDGLDLNTPSIRMPGSAPDDQARTATPSDALRRGATRLVVGRPLTKGNIAANFASIITDMELGLTKSSS